MRVSRREAVLGRVLLVLLMVITIVPFVSLFLTALQPAGTYPDGVSWPDHPQWGNFVDAFRAARMGHLLWSSVLIVAGVVPLSLLFAAMAGYAFGQVRMPGHRWVFLLFVLGLTLPFEGILTPLYFQVRDMGLLNTRWAIILPLIGLFMPFSVLWMRAHFVTMPPDIAEAAEIDGANEWQAFWRVHIRLATPALSSLAILLFLWTWNQFLLAIVLVDDPLKRTMAGALGAFQGQYGTDIPLLCAGSLLILAPTLAVFLVFQRRFVTALLQGSVKGVTLPRPQSVVEQVEFLRYTQPERWSTLGRFPVDVATTDALLAAMMATGRSDLDTARAALDTDVAERVAGLMADATFASALRRLPFGPADRVVAVGDSITADRSGWFELVGAALARAGEPHAALVNLGVSGSTTADALERFDLLEAARPTHVLLMLGTNDARGHGRLVRRTMVSLAETTRNLAVLGELVTGELGCELVVMTPPACDAERVGKFFADLPLGWQPGDVDAVAEVVRRVPARVVDVHAFTRRHADPATYADDGVHLSPAGQQQLATFVVDQLAGPREA